MADVLVKDLLGFLAMGIAGILAFFNLRGRVAIIEARQQDDRKAVEKTMSRIEGSLDRIESKLDGKADK